MWRKAHPPFVTLQENASWVAVWRKARSVATKCFFGVGGSAILSPGDYRAFRIPNTEVKNPHCRRMRLGRQCGERLFRLSHRQVTSEKTNSSEVVFSAFLPLRSKHQGSGPGGSIRSIHRGGVGVLGCCAAIVLPYP
jgi:hypothetical protein